MIIGIGIDLVQITRMDRWVINDSLLERFFSLGEVAAIKQAGKKASESAAVRFASKEAFGKALGCGLSGFNLNEVSVVKNEMGRPSLELTGKALALFQASGADSLFLSLSHEKEVGAAVVVIENQNINNERVK